MQHAEDAGDHNLPLMVWFGVEALVPADLPRALALADQCKLPIVNQYIARRAADGTNKPNIATVIAHLGQSKNDELKKSMLIGLREALAGQRNVGLPDGWAKVFPLLMASKSGDVRAGAIDLGLVFGDPAALATLRQQAADDKNDAASRERAVQGLIAAKAADLAPLLHGMLDTPELSGVAIRGLAAVGAPESAKEILKRYPKLSAEQKMDAVSALVSRPPYAAELLDAVGAGVVAKSDLTPQIVRQLGGMSDKTVKTKLAAVWGDVRPPEKDKVAKIAKTKKEFTAEQLKTADLSQGRLVFSKTCMACHKLFDEGGKVGPDLTGSQRAISDYIIENVVDPSAQVAAEYRLAMLETKDDRQIEGIVVNETEKSVTIRTTTEDVLVAKSDIATRRQSPLSMMPEGLFEGLTHEQRRDLLAYLASPRQVAMPAGSDGATK